MEIVRLPVGERAPIDSDCISIDQSPDGNFNLTGSILAADESVALVSPIICDTRESAEQQGVAWAQGCGVPKLFIATMLIS